MTLSEKAAYLKGLMDGLKLDTEKDENKVLAAVVDMLSDVAETVSDLEDVVDTISDELAASDAAEEDAGASGSPPPPQDVNRTPAISIAAAALANESNGLFLFRIAVSSFPQF